MQQGQWKRRLTGNRGRSRYRDSPLGVLVCSTPETAASQQGGSCINVLPNQRWLQYSRRPLHLVGGRSVWSSSLGHVAELYHAEHLSVSIPQEFHSTDADRASFLSFVARVDSSLLHHYHSVMGHLQVMWPSLPHLLLPWGSPWTLGALGRSGILARLSLDCETD